MLKELFSYMKQYKKYALISLVCIAVECIFELIIPLIMADMVDVGIANGDQDYILHQGLVMIGCAGLALVLGICSARFCALCGQGFGANLREAEYRKLQSYSFSNIDHFQVSSLVTRLTSDVTVIQNSVSTGIRPLCRAPVMLFMATGSAFVINARLALVFLVALPVLGFLLFEIVSHVGPLYTKMQTGIDRVNRIVQENLTAVRVVRSYVRENYEQEKFDDANLALRTESEKAFGLSSMNMAAMQFVNRLSGFQIQTNVRKHIFLRVFAVLKKYMVETDRALFHTDRTCLFLRDLWLFVQNLENSGSARHRTGQHHKDIRQHHQGV